MSQNLIAIPVTLGIVEDDIEVIQYLTRAFGEEASERHKFKFQVISTNDYRIAKDWANADLVDIYIIDLGLPDFSKGICSDWQIGRNLIRHIHTATTAGIIVYTSEHLADRADALLSLGVDDFIRKAEVLGEFGGVVENMQSYLRAKVFSVWKRTQFARPKFKTLLKHGDRKFQLGRWLFAIESRWIEADGEKQNLTANEHAVLRHLCVSEEHSIDQSEFLSFITGQKSDSEDVRLKNLIYRLRKKLRGVELVHSDFSYRLLSIAEIPNTKPSTISGQWVLCEIS